MPDAQRLPSFNVGVIGHVQDGKTTLTAALTWVARAEPRSPEDLIEPGHRWSGQTVVGRPVEYATERRRYAHWDCPGHPDRGKNAVRAIAQLDAAVLVVSAAAGPRAQTREHLLFAHAQGVAHVLVFLNMCDIIDAPELLDMVEGEVRELLGECGYDGDAVPVIRGSALRALEGGERGPLHELLAALDLLPLPQRRCDGPLLMPVATRYARWAYRRDPRGAQVPGTIAVGRIERGALRLGDTVELIGHEGPRTGQVVQLRSFARIVDELDAGELCGCQLARVDPWEVARGQVLTHPGALSTHRACLVRLRLLPRGPGDPGPATFRSGYRPQVFVRVADITGTLQLVDGARASPGEVVSAVLTLDLPTVLAGAPGLLLRDAGRTVAVGTIVEPLAGAADL